ncbi:winged helix-turn-helix transcriptional regulator [Gillisia sp. Q332]
MAELLNLTTSPVYERIKQLERKGYIKKYVALINKNLINILQPFA